MTSERDQELTRVTAWLERAYLCITDASEKRRRNVALLDGHLISEVPESYHVTRKEIDEEFRTLLLELQDRVIPDVESALPDSVDTFTELRKRLLDLRIAIYRPGSEDDGLGRKHELLTRLAERSIRNLDLIHASGRVAATTCPGCEESYEDPESLRLHFLAKHRPPDRKGEIAEAVGKCRAEWVEADQAVRRGVELSSSQETPPESAPADTSTATNEFRREGEGWRLRFDGGPPAWVKDAVGMGYLCELLKQPLKVFDVRELSASFDPEAETAGLESPAQRELQGVGGDGRGFDEIKADPAAVRDYSERLLKLPGEIDDAKERKDHDLREKLEAEEDFLKKELQRGQRRTAPVDAENTRKAVGKAIKRAIDQISEEMPALGDHLKKHVSPGAQCFYGPPEEIVWEG